MQKSEFVNKLAIDLDCSNTQAELSFNAVIKGLKDLLMRGEDFTIPGVGRFSVAHKAARQGRNPKNGQVLEISAKAVPLFKAGDALTRMLHKFCKILFAVGFGKILSA